MIFNNCFTQDDSLVSHISVIRYLQNHFHWKGTYICIPGTAYARTQLHYSKHIYLYDCPEELKVIV